MKIVFEELGFLKKVFSKIYNFFCECFGSGMPLRKRFIKFHMFLKFKCVVNLFSFYKAMWTNQLQKIKSLTSPDLPSIGRPPIFPENISVLCVATKIHFHKSQRAFGDHVYRNLKAIYEIFGSLAFRTFIFDNFNAPFSIKKTGCISNYFGIYRRYLV